MIKADPTRLGTGIQFWGGYDDLYSLYLTVMKLSSEADMTYDAREARDMIIYDLMHSIRAAYMGKLDKGSSINHEGELDGFFGFKYSWINLIFAISALRHNAAYTVLDDRDQENLGHIEVLTKKALIDFDKKGAHLIIPFVGGGGIGVHHELLWQFSNQLTIDYYELKPNLSRFRKIPEMLNQTKEFYPMHNFLVSKIQAQADAIGCPANEMDYLEYNNIKW